ncbi:MAG: VOC family protein [Actinobacteria bacterium]|nr:VOC family protein [Actinomycetota bacterium]
MTSQLYTVTLDAAEPRRLADFWSKMLDYKVVYDSAEEVAIEKADESGPAVLFVRVPDEKAGKNRMHFDLNPDDQAAEVERALSLGATHVDIGQGRDPDVTWKVLADPEGNEFCILTPRKN